MDFSEDLIRKLKTASFNYALYSTENIEVANDISSQAIGLFLLAYKEDRNPMGWIILTTKNFCKKYFSSTKRENNIRNNYKNEVLHNLIHHIEPEKDEALPEAFKESFSALTPDELKTILYYFQCGESLKTIHQNIGGSYSSIKVKISRIKRTLKAETYMRLGYIGTKKIVTPQLNEMIVKFLKRFKQHLESNTLEQMYYYFSKIDLEKYHETFQIKEILEYDIDLVDSIYKTWVFYRDYQDVIKSFSIKFIVDDKSRLKVVAPPTLSPKTIVFDSDSEQGKQLENLIKMFPPDKSGRPNIPPEELEKLIKQIEDANKSE